MAREQCSVFLSFSLFLSLSLAFFFSLFLSLSLALSVYSHRLCVFTRERRPFDKGARGSDPGVYAAWRRPPLRLSPTYTQHEYDQQDCHFRRTITFRRTDPQGIRARPPVSAR